MVLYRRSSPRFARRSYGGRGYSSIARRTRGNFRAGRQGTDSTNVTIQGMTTLPIRVTTSNAYTTNGQALGISIWQLLINSDFYANYATMYDELRMNGFRLKIIGNSAGTTVLASGLSSAGTVVALDRNGVRGKPATFRGGEDGGTTANPFIELDETEKSRSWQQALSYGSAKIKSWSPGNAFQQWISANVSSMIEKSQYVKTQELTPSRVRTTGSGAGAQQQYIQGFPSGFVAGQGATALGNQFTRWTGTSDISFDPAILLGVYNVPNTQAGVEAEQIFTFSIEFKIDVTFRGVRRSTFNDVMQGAGADRTMSLRVENNGQLSVDVGDYTTLALTTDVQVPERDRRFLFWEVRDVVGGTNVSGDYGDYKDWTHAAQDMSVNMLDTEHIGKSWLVLRATPYPIGGDPADVEEAYKMWALSATIFNMKSAAEAGSLAVTLRSGDYYYISEISAPNHDLAGEAPLLMTGLGNDVTTAGQVTMVDHMIIVTDEAEMAKPALLMSRYNAPEGWGGPADLQMATEGTE